jgi:hypothetical protein
MLALAALFAACSSSCLGVEPVAPAPGASVTLPPPSVAAPSNDASFESADRPVTGAVRLTSSDGTGLHLTSYRARTVIEEPIAFTEVDVAYENPEARVLEGHFEVALPGEAALSRFAMQIEGAYQEGEIVERQVARETYESFLQRRRDPALLEQGAGNTFAARVFPIAPRSEKHLRFSYSEILRDSRPFRLPVAGLGVVHDVSIRVASVDAREPLVSIEGEDVDLSKDVEALRHATGSALGRTANGVAILRVPVPAGEPPRERGDDTRYFLVDASASRSLDYHASCATVAELVRASGDDTRVVVATFDQTVDPLFEGRAADFDAAAARRLEARGALGGSDLAGALAWASDRAEHAGTRSRLVLVGDGVATAGPTTASPIAASLARGGRRVFSRVDVVSAGGIVDDASLHAMALAGARAGIVVDAREGSGEIARRLDLETLPALDVDLPGARWFSPRSFSGVQPGDTVTVFAELDRARPSVDVRLGDASTRVPLLASEGPLVERAVAAARIESLEGETETPEIRARIIDLSKRHRVLSRHTAMLVLETDDDYERFHIPRAATTTILAVSADDRVRTTHVPRLPRRPRATSSSPSSPAAPPPSPSSLAAPAPSSSSPAAPPSSSSSPAAPAPSSPSLPLSGLGEGGGGRGAGFGQGMGRLGGSHRTKPPQVRMGATMVTGRLPPEIVQRIVRQNFGRFRLCYENELRLHPSFEGRVVLGFVITTGGDAKGARVRESESKSEPFHACLVDAISALSFPAQDSGPVTVTYPIQFSPGDGAPPPPEHAGPQRSSFARSTPGPDAPPWAGTKPYTGKFAEVMDELAQGSKPEALVQARQWAKTSPDDALAFVALGEAAEANQSPALAARAYGSLFELWSYRADMRRFAGERLDRLAHPEALDLAIDTYRKAVADRPDNPGGHRLLAYALARRGRYADAFAAISAGLGRVRDDRLYRGVNEILRADAGVLAAAWERAEPWHGVELADKTRCRHRAHADLALRALVGDRRERRRSARVGRRPASRLLRRSIPRERRAPLRRRHHWLRSRGARRPARSPTRLGAVALRARRPLLRSRRDGLRHGQARDRRARRPRQALLRGAPLRGHDRSQRPRSRRLRSEGAPDRSSLRLLHLQPAASRTNTRRP